ncbi:hypothetical protein HHI36_011230 [Cryptolaemus montrouzieri]|uniref:Cyclic nucleotide-binding domain-containing protein n=1 Tax=Cryptolaemus montrouzieri TaxID=559131 RepID=A0ABD2ML46_9CUCU
MGKHMGYLNHECDLPLSVDSCLLELPPYLPKYKRWFFSMKKFFTIDERSARTKRFFRSYATVMSEKKRHAEGEYSKIIHPFSRCAIYKERLICILWMTSLLLDPIRWSIFMPCDTDHALFKIQLALDVAFLLNVVVTCFTGYCVPLTREIIFSPKIILKNMALSYLVPETLSSLPYKHVLLKCFGINPRKSRAMAICAIRLLRICRLTDMIRYLINILQELNIPESISTIMIVFLMAFFMIYWSACGLYFVSICYYTWDGLPTESWLFGGENKDMNFLHKRVCSGTAREFFDLLVTTFIRSTCHFFGASEGYREIILTVEKLVCALVLVSGYIYSNYAMAKVLELFGSVNISESKYEELIYQVSEYVRSKHLSENLRKRLILYYEYKFQKRFFKEEEILATLSEHLRCEVFLHTCRNILERVPLFQGMSKGVIGSVIGYLKREIYLPNDVVIKYGEPLTKMFWISHGTLAVYFGTDMTEILHFEDGDHFGDYSILKKGGTAYLSIVALEITEIFTLARKDVKHCTAFVKEMTEKVIRIGKEKIHLYTSLAKMMSDEGSQNMVLADLRKGRILEKDRWRKKRPKTMVKSSAYSTEN